MDRTDPSPNAAAAAPDGTGMAPFEHGALIDGFRLEQKLHQGGMAQLWRVSRDGVGDAGPALLMKVPRLRRGGDPASFIGFQVEQMILPRLRGRHVPAFVARGDVGGHPYLVMERVHGTNLRSRLEAAPLPIDEVAALGAQVADALHDLHSQRVVHLDLKPSNVMLRSDGGAVLLDFGLSRHADLPDLLEEASPLPVGTGPYIAPEQLQQARGEPRSDLFALGVMLYHLCTGRRPFGRPETLRGLRRRLHAAPVPPRHHRPDCPPWLQEVILSCLEVDPDRRPVDAAALARALRQPDTVALGERARRLRPAGPWARWRAWWARPSSRHEAPPARARRGPVVVVALDVEHASDALLARMAVAAQRLLHDQPDARLACVSVIKAGGIAIDRPFAADGRSRQLLHLLGLQRWARPLANAHELDETRLSLHVLEGPDVGALLVDFARRNRVDHVLIGARASSAWRRHVGSVSSCVAAQVRCSVTVVRALDDAGDTPRVAEPAGAPHPQAG